MHYTTSGKATVDETQVGIYLHDKPPSYVMSEGVAGQRRFFVPAHTKEHPLQGEQLIEKDAWLYSMTPHMHFRGKYMRKVLDWRPTAPWTIQTAIQVTQTPASRCTLGCKQSTRCSLVSLPCVTKVRRLNPFAG